MSDFKLEVAQRFDQKLRSDEADFYDRKIGCIDCGKTFIWTIGEQIFFRDKGLSHPPKRCRPCKRKKNERIALVEAGHASGIKQRIEVTVNCAKCECSTTVPFYPSQGRPVFCRSCYIDAHPEVLQNGNGADIETE